MVWGYYGEEQCSESSVYREMDVEAEGLSAPGDHKEAYEGSR